MSFIKTKLKKLRSKPEFSSVRILIFTLVFAIVGSVIIIATHAASPAASIESEDGVITSPATKISDTSASNGSAVVFNKPPAGNPVVDASTPVMANVGRAVNSVSTAAFSPPANTMLYAAFSIDSPYIAEPGQTYVANPHLASITNTGNHLTWTFMANESTNTTRVGGYVEVWRAYNASAQSSITVTGNFAQTSKDVTPPTGGFQVLVVDNAAADQTTSDVQATVSLNNLSNTSATVNAPAGSLVLAVGDSWNSVDNPPTFPAGQILHGLVVNNPDVDSYWTWGLSQPTSNAGSVNMVATLSRPDAWHEIAWVVQPN